MKKLKKFWKKIKDKGKRINLSPPFKLSKPLNIGVIGAGIQASRLVGQVIDAGAKIVAVHDVKTEAAQKLANLSDSNLSTTNLDEFFDVPMDGLLLCSIPTVRVEPIKRACDKKIHLLIEKPAAHNLNTGQKCLDYIEKADVISSVGFQFRYEPRYEKLKQLIEGQTIHGGMIPKVNTCIDAINNGVRAVVIIDGRKPHSILFELFSDKGSGTLMRK